MAMTMSLKTAMAQVFALKDEDKAIIIPCDDIYDANSKRASLSYIRRNMVQSGETLAERIRIRRVRIKGTSQYKIELSLDMNEGVHIEKKDGSTKSLKLENPYHDVMIDRKEEDD